MLLSRIFTDSDHLEFVPSLVDKSAAVGEESAVDGVEDGKLSQSLHRKEQHESNNDEPNELGMPSALQRLGRYCSLWSHTTLPGPPLLKD